MRIARELGIEPVIKKITFGSGQEADIERIRVALISNVAFAPLKPKDRKRIATHLRVRGWTMQRIARALSVHHATISNDLRDQGTLLIDNNVEPRRDTRGRRRSPGRPRSSRSGQVSITPAQEEAAASQVIDQHRPRSEVAAEYGMGEHVVQLAVNRERGRRQEREEPTVDPSTLSMTSQQRLEAAIRQATRRLEVQFEHRVQAEITRIINEGTLPHWRERLAEADRIVKSRGARGAMTNAEYRNIFSCLHTDRLSSLYPRHAVDADLIRRYERAFNSFREVRTVLVGESEAPTTPQAPGVPRTRAEWDAAREATRQARRARRYGQMARS